MIMIHMKHANKYRDRITRIVQKFANDLCGRLTKDEAKHFKDGVVRLVEKEILACSKEQKAIKQLFTVFNQDISKIDDSMKKVLDYIPSEK